VTQALHFSRDTLQGRPGVTAAIVPNPTINPLDRLHVAVEPAVAHITAWDLAGRLASGSRPVIVRDHEIEHGYFLMDPCTFHPGEEAIVAARLAQELDRALASSEIIATSAFARRARHTRSRLAWSD
jgi:L-seryl-tRNA(Ser) seleniumtransferase